MSTTLSDDAVHKVMDRLIRREGNSISYSYIEIELEHCFPEEESPESDSSINQRSP